MRMEETIAAPPRKKRPCVSDVCCLVGNFATGDDYRWRAVAGPWRGGAVRLGPLAGGAARVLEGHTQNVNGVAFAPDGRTLVSVSYDQSVRIWPIDGETPTVVAIPSPLNAVAIGSNGEIATGGADGKLYFLTGAGAPAGEIAAGPRPVISIAISPDGALVAAASVGGSVALIDLKTRALAPHPARPGLPVFSSPFIPDSHTLPTGGGAKHLRRIGGQRRRD